jgi:AraC-like DNA-binding protein
LAYIDSHLEQALNSQHLADLINLEVTELEWSFEKMMGLSLQSYIHEQRQQRLQRLLKTMSLGQPLVLPSNHLRPNANAITVGFYPSNPTNPPQHPSIQAAIAWLNQRLLVVTGKPLTDTQVRILTGVLQGQRYGQMAQQYNQSEGHLKGVAADLWKQLSLICGEPIRKPNLWAYLQRQGLLTDAKPALSTDRQPL